MRIFGIRVLSEVANSKIVNGLICLSVCCTSVLLNAQKKGASAGPIPVVPSGLTAVMDFIPKRNLGPGAMMAARCMADSNSRL